MQDVNPFCPQYRNINKSIVDAGQEKKQQVRQ